MEEKKIYEVYSLLHIDLSDHVRLQPKIYFEECFQENNLNAIILGAVCHAIDEYFDGYCNEIIINADAISFLKMEKQFLKKLPEQKFQKNLQQSALK